MYKIGDKVIVKYCNKFGFITRNDNNKEYFVYVPCGRWGSWYNNNEIEPYRLSDEEAWQYIQERVIDESSFEDGLKSDEVERLKNLMIKAFNAGMSYR